MYFISFLVRRKKKLLHYSIGARVVSKKLDPFVRPHGSTAFLHFDNFACNCRAVIFCRNTEKYFYEGKISAFVDIKPY